MAARGLLPSHLREKPNFTEPELAKFRDLLQNQIKSIDHILEGFLALASIVINSGMEATSKAAIGVFVNKATVFLGKSPSVFSGPILGRVKNTLPGEFSPAIAQVVETCVRKTKVPINKKSYAQFVDVKVEEKKGGVKFELIECPANTPPPKKSSSPTRTISSENIEEKLKAAEERRLSLEAEKINKLAAKLSKIEDAMKKKDELQEEFKRESKKVLEEKMEQYSEKREARMTEVICKLKKQSENVEKARLIWNKEIEEIKENTNKKLKEVSEKRDKHLQELTKKLKEHDEHAKSVCGSMKEKRQIIEQQIQAKHEEALLRKEQIKQEMIEKLKNQETRFEKVRQNRNSESGAVNGAESPASG